MDRLDAAPHRLADMADDGGGDIRIEIEIRRQQGSADRNPQRGSARQRLDHRRGRAGDIHRLVKEQELVEAVEFGEIDAVDHHREAEFRQPLLAQAQRDGQIGLERFPIVGHLIGGDHALRAQPHGRAMGVGGQGEQPCRRKDFRHDVVDEFRMGAVRQKDRFLPRPTGLGGVSDTHRDSSGTLTTERSAASKRRVKPSTSPRVRVQASPASR